MVSKIIIDRYEELKKQYPDDISLFTSPSEADEKYTWSDMYVGTAGEEYAQSVEDWYVALQSGVCGICVK